MWSYNKDVVRPCSNMVKIKSRPQTEMVAKAIVVRNQRVGISKFPGAAKLYGSVAPIGRAPDLHSGRWEFESLRIHEIWFFNSVDLECLVYTEEVVGLNPTRTTNKLVRWWSWLSCYPVTVEFTGSYPVRTAKLPKWDSGWLRLICNQYPKGHVGSNPAFGSKLIIDLNFIYCQMLWNIWQFFFVLYTEFLLDICNIYI